MTDTHTPTGLSKIRARLSSTSARTVASPEAAAIHQRVDQLSELELRDVMTPRVDVIYLNSPVTPEAIAEAIRDTGHSVFPVVDDDDLDQVLGVLFVNDLFRSSSTKRAIGVSLPQTSEITRKIRRPLMLPETLDLLDALAEMRKQHRTFALALDEHGGVAGVISIRDILEQLVGDLSDEFDDDDEPMIVKIRQNRWLVDGQTHVDRVSEETGIEIPDGDYVTIAGFLLFLADDIPEEGDTVTYGNWTLRAQTLEKRRISEVVIERHEHVTPRDPDLP
jgi:CBS domain containing-hemolysin-like protein